MPNQAPLGFTRDELKVIRQGKVSGTKEGVEQLLERSIPDDEWDVLTKQKIDQLLRWGETDKDAIFIPFYKKTRK